MSVTVTLTDDEALVLFELLASDNLQVAPDSAEWHALNSIECDLEKQLVQPFSPTYGEDLQNARKRILAKL